eukprot:9017245-Pyramimonas_sp.AAC.1
MSTPATRFAGHVVSKWCRWLSDVDPNDSPTDQSQSLDRNKPHPPTNHCPLIGIFASEDEFAARIRLRAR